MKNILIILGTRPEAIKLAPVIKQLKSDKRFQVFVCNTEQQKELSNQTLGFFGIKADFNLDIMSPNQSLSLLQSKLLIALTNILEAHNFDATVVQGDTMSVLCGALASFYNQIPVFHVEAGLRSYNLSEPFPEEAIRQMTTRISSLHFAPTQRAVEALTKEGIASKRIILTGNTGIDALFCLEKETIRTSANSLRNRKIIFNNKIVLCTVHRRENHGPRLNNIINAISILAKKHQDHQFVIPVHPNPNVKEKIYRNLESTDNIILLPPLDYPELVYLLKHSKLVLTDSGGIQEEAPSFGVPLLVMRYETERIEGVIAGFSTLVGADTNKIYKYADKILSADFASTRLESRSNPYGDGKAAERITKSLAQYWSL